MDHDPPLGKPIDPALLALAGQLPRKPAAITLEGQLVTVRPLDAAADSGPLFEATHGRPMTLGSRAVATYDADLLVWRYLPAGPFTDAAELRESLESQAAAPDGTPLTVVDRQSGQPIGIVNLMSNEPANLKIELGGIWYAPIVQGTGANLESTWLLLRHAFGLGYRRVEWKCDSLNERSRRSALRMGFRFEGIQEQHRMTKSRNRDTAWFRIVAEEWPGVDIRLRGLLSRGRDVPA